MDQIVPGTTSKGVLYINTGGTQQEDTGWGLNGLRVWADVGVKGLVSNTFPKAYFASIARQWARSFYWQIDPHAVPVGETFAGHPSLPVYVGTVSPNAGASAAVQSLASTLDFLYFFSGDADTSLPSVLQKQTYAAALPINISRSIPNPSSIALPDIYLWVFANRTSIFAKNQKSQAAVNIPSAFGMHVDYYEAAARRRPNGTLMDLHDVPPLQVSRSDDPPGRKTTTWPNEDQLHHFAGYFYLGAWIYESIGNVTPLQSPPGQLVRLGAEVGALKSTGDWPKPNNPGDYDLGLVADDIGLAYQGAPGYSSNANIRIWPDLSASAPQAYSADGRTQSQFP